ADLADAVPRDLQFSPGPPPAAAGDDDGYDPPGLGVDDEVGVVDDAKADALVDVDDLLAGQIAVAHRRASSPYTLCRRAGALDARPKTPDRTRTRRRWRSPPRRSQAATSPRRAAPGPSRSTSSTLP